MFDLLYSWKFGFMPTVNFINCMTNTLQQKVGVITLKWLGMVTNRCFPKSWDEFISYWKLVLYAWTNHKINKPKTKNDIINYDWNIAGRSSENTFKTLRMMFLDLFFSNSRNFLEGIAVLQIGVVKVGILLYGYHFINNISVVWREFSVYS